VKNFLPFQTIAVAVAAGLMIETANANLTFSGVAAGDATTHDVIVWTRAKDESNPQPTNINVQITTDPTFTSGVSTLLAGTAAGLTDYTVKTNIGSLQSGTVYYYRFQTMDGLITSNIGKSRQLPVLWIALRCVSG
jgi:phosphodiesterase/alkaline phosphatase D-like protein